MKSIWASVLVTLTSLVGVQSQVFYPGQCIPQTVKQHFDVERYLGTWFENRNYFAFFQLKSTCVTATYSSDPDDPTIVKVLNSGLKLGSANDIEGQAEIVDPSLNEGRLRVSFPGNPFSDSMGDPTDNGNYWILDTDYDSYAIVWTCRQKFPKLNSQYLWILTRERFPSLKTITKALNSIEVRGLDTNALVITEQTDCPDPPELPDAASTGGDSGGPVSAEAGGGKKRKKWTKRNKNKDLV